MGNKGEIELVKYVDNLIDITKDQINYFLKEIKRPHKNISKNKLKNDNKKISQNIVRILLTKNLYQRKKMNSKIMKQKKEMV